MEHNTSHEDTAPAAEYEPPAGVVIGSFAGLTQAGATGLDDTGGGLAELGGS